MFTPTEVNVKVNKLTVHTLGVHTPTTPAKTLYRVFTACPNRAIHIMAHSHCTGPGPEPGMGKWVIPGMQPIGPWFRSLSLYSVYN